MERLASTVDAGVLGAPWRVGIDVGGTFTDVVAWNARAGEQRAAKVATDLDDRVRGVRAALAAVGLDWDEVGDLVHGTTLVTNAIVEGDLAEVALITTQGFADTLEIGRQNRLHLYRLDLPPKLAPLVPAGRRFEVAERLDHHGAVLRPLEEAEARRAVQAVRASGARAVAVSLLHAYANPAHEQALAGLLAEGCEHVALSHRVNPEAREYERTATTVLSAAVMPVAGRYLERLERASPSTSRLHLFHSAGGMAAPAALRDLPLGLALSGPAAGVAAAAAVARELGIDRAISLDMGGTTADVCLIRDGRPEIDTDRRLAGRPLRQPMVAVESIGAGGGSVAVLDRGALRVGPESAGADPGPACYARGGTRPTVTDANLLLGYLDRGRLFGDGLRLDPQAARAALEALATGMGMPVEQAALGVLRVVDGAMVGALRRITVERGVDGRDCTLLAFGGAGPMHAVAVARAFGIARVVVPALSGAFSALGCVHARPSYAQQCTVRMSSQSWEAERLARVREELRGRLAAPLLAAGHAREGVAWDTVAAVRYSGQSYALEIADADLEHPGALGEAFEDLHRRVYGYATGEPWELVAVRERASAAQGEHARVADARPAVTPGQPRPGRCTFAAAGTVATPRHERAAIRSGATVAGPAVIEDAHSTIVLPPGASARAEAAGHIVIDVGAPA